MVYPTRYLILKVIILTPFLAAILTACRFSETRTKSVQPLSPQIGHDIITTAASPGSTATITPSQIPTAITLSSSTPPTSPTPTATPVPTLIQLTTGGCCTQSFWSPDSERVLFIDKPDLGSPTGLWGVGLRGGPPQFVTDHLGVFSPDMQWRAFPQNGQTVVEYLPDNARWKIYNGGRPVSFSPDGLSLVWTAGNLGLPFDTSQRLLWISQIDGSHARMIMMVYGGGFAGWFPDGRLLVTGRLNLKEKEQSFWSLDPQNGSLAEIVRATSPRGYKLSPDGKWLVYYVAFSSDSAENGLWLVNTETRELHRLDLFGAYRWRTGDRLLVIPLDATASSNRLWQVDVGSPESNDIQANPLTDPALTPFKIANDDWQVSPDGRFLSFVSALDHNIWLLKLP